MGFFDFLKPKPSTEVVRKKDAADELIDWFELSPDRINQIGYKKINGYEVEVVCNTNYPQHSRIVAIPSKTRGYIVTSLKRMAIYGKDVVKLPDTIQVMKSHCLQGCTFSSFTLPADLRIMEHEAMFRCDGLVTISMPDKLEQVTGNPFIKCDKLSSIYVKPSHEVFASIDGVLFHKKEKRLICFPAGHQARTYNVPQGIRSIGLGAFHGAGLHEVHIPSSVEKIDGNPFAYCTWLKTITVAEDNPFFASVDGVLYDKNFTRMIACPTNYLTGTRRSIKLPGTVQVIGAHACEALEGTFVISLPEGLTDIEEHAFDGCRGMSAIAFPSTMKRIGKSAFAHNRMIDEIIIPESVIKISDNAFAYESALKKVTLCCSDVQLGKEVFCGCGKLEEIHLPDQLKTIQQGMFENAESLTTINLPAALNRIEAEAFKKTRLGRIRIPDGVSYIGEGAFAECANITFLTPQNSYADQYGKRHGILTAKPDDVFWLDA